ncbi:hypothetical protein PI125_g14848 [Phytophthora idaei]|nr:hypothetical protein PI125_g14848 [Phytophthora idaei]
MQDDDDEAGPRPHRIYDSVEAVEPRSKLFRPASPSSTRTCRLNHHQLQAAIFHNRDIDR